MTNIPHSDVIRELPAEDLAAILCDGGAEVIVDMINDSANSHQMVMEQPVFHDAPELLYVALRLASLSGVTVLLVPETKRVSAADQ